MRDLDPAVSADLRLGTSRNAVIPFLRIRVDHIPGGLAYVGDNRPHVRGGVTYAPIGTGIAPPEQSDTLTPSMTIRLPDVDRRLGMALQHAVNPSTVEIDWYPLGDLAYIDQPIVATGAWLIKSADKAGGVVTLTLEKPSLDMEPWPALRAVLGIAPGVNK